MAFALLSVGLLSIFVYPWNWLFQGNKSAVVLFEIPEGKELLVTPAAPLRVNLGVREGWFTTLHINQWIEGEVKQTFYLVDETAGVRHVLSRRSVNRHRSFNLSPLLRARHSYSLVMDVHGAPGSGHSLVNELTVREFPNIFSFPRMDLVLAALFFSLLIFLRLFNHRSAWLLKDWEIAGLLMLFGFSLRWLAVRASFGHPLEGDSQGYHDLALAMSWLSPFQNGIREPLYIWIQKLWMSVAGSDVWKFRAATVVMSTISIGVIYALCLAFSKRRLIAVVACLVVAAGEFAVGDAIRGERSQLFCLLILLFSLGIVRGILRQSKAKRSWLWSA